MKSVVLVLALAVVACQAIHEQEKYQQLNIEAIVADEKQITTFTNCFLDPNLCNEKTRAFRADFLDAVPTACKSCSDLQKHILRRFFEGASAKTPQSVQALLKQFDPQNQYLAPLQAAIAAY